MFFYTKVDDAWRPYQVWRHVLGEHEAKDVLVHQEARRAVLDRHRPDPLRAVPRSSSPGPRSPPRSGYLDAADPTGEFAVVGNGRAGRRDRRRRTRATGCWVLHNTDAENFALGWTPSRHRASSMRSSLIDESRPARIRRRLRRPRGRRRCAALGSRRSRSSEPAGKASGADDAVDRDPVRRADLRRRPRGEPRVRLAPDPPRLQLARHAVLGVRLRRRRPANCCCASASPCSAASTRPTTRSSANGPPPPTAPRCRSRSCGKRGRHRATGPRRAAVRLRLVRALDRPVLLDRPAVPARPRRGLRDRARARRRRDGPPVVRARARCSHKRNTFTDFVDVRPSTWSTPAGPRPTGSSPAGGSRRRPADGRRRQPRARSCSPAILAEVPFVDALTTILDPSLPLTVIEWDEWGDPLRRPPRSTRT